MTMQRNTPRPEQPPTRRTLLHAGSALLVGLLAGVARAGSREVAPLPLLEVWKDPDCGCCNDWIRHVEASGLRTRVHDTGNLQAKAREAGTAETFADLARAQPWQVAARIIAILLLLGLLTLPYFLLRA